MEEVQTEYGDKRRSVCRTAGWELHTKCALRHTGGDLSPAFGDFAARGFAGVTIVRSVIRRGRNTGAMTSSRTLRVQSPAIPFVLGRPALEPVRLSGRECVNALFEYELL